MATPATCPQAKDLSAHLTSKHLPPTPTFLTTILSTARPSTPLPALQRTALFRLLASDITSTVAYTPASMLPANIHDAGIKERRLAGPIPVQVLDIEDIGHSRWSQVEALEAAERGEMTKGREVIRVVADRENDAAPEESASSGPHKLLLQDAAGAKVYGVELMGVEGIGLGMNIGAKMVLREVVVARGVVLLEPRSVTVLGGKIEGLHKQWRDGRKERLKAAVGMAERRA
ncbi:DUF1767-domain-containing protein [Lepidopterella palustris CBS 459.81]|uniref:RecQ-mediated genome instability protein 1 n=1 Tax=Lepidopterella palustris CBS 459.81 TaxID=1314670 RepID=A0A8E2JGP3_9PEZI|nr:DUF1767-domain-containing protein [Lepidopterella palustris CBS 459.81]